MVGCWGGDEATSGEVEQTVRQALAEGCDLHNIKRVHCREVADAWACNCSSRETAGVLTLDDKDNPEVSTLYC